MAYLVTGATGFIGRRLVERLLANRQGKVYVLVRGSSTGRLDDLIERWQGVPGGRGRQPPGQGLRTGTRELDRQARRSDRALAGRRRRERRQARTTADRRPAPAAARGRARARAGAERKSVE